MPTSSPALWMMSTTNHLSPKALCHEFSGGMGQPWTALTQSPCSSELSRSGHTSRFSSPKCLCRSTSCEIPFSVGKASCRASHCLRRPRPTSSPASCRRLARLPWRSARSERLCQITSSRCAWKKCAPIASLDLATSRVAAPHSPPN